jgi:hypothetical protein
MNKTMSAAVEQLQADLCTAMQCLEEAEHYKQRTQLTVQALEHENEELINNMSASVEQLQADVCTALQCLDEAESYKQRTILAVQALEHENEELVEEVQDMLDEEQEMQTHIQIVAIEYARLKLQNKCLQEDRDALTDCLLHDETNPNTKYSQAELELKIEQARTEERSKIVSIAGEQQRAHDTIQTLQKEKDQMQAELERLVQVHTKLHHIRQVSAASTLFTSFRRLSSRGSCHSSAATMPSGGNSRAAGTTFSWLNQAIMNHLLVRGTGEPNTKATLPNVQHVSLSPKEPASARGAEGHFLRSRRFLSMTSHTTTNNSAETCSFEKKKSSPFFQKEGQLECNLVEPGDHQRRSSLNSFLFEHCVVHDEPSTLVREVQDHNLYSKFGQLSTSIQFEDNNYGSTFVSNSGEEWPFDLTREAPQAEETPLVSLSQSRIIKKKIKTPSAA